MPVFDDLFGKLMHHGELFKNFLVGTRAGLRFLQNRQAELVEQDRTQLFRRIDIELFVGQFVNLVDQLFNA